MNTKSKIFINGFQTGTKQNSNLGTSAIVGFDAYSKPGAVILGKMYANSSVSLNLNEYPTYMDISQNSNGVGSISVSGRLWMQTSQGNAYYSDNYGTSFTQASFTGTPPGGSGNGLIVYENFVFIFFDDEIWYATAAAASPNFVQWKTNIQGGTQQSFSSPIHSNHFPYLFPNNRGVYFANNNCVGFFGQVFPVGATVPTAFNPAGTINTNYQYNNTILTLPSNYSVNTLDYLPPSSLAIGANNINSGQEADITTWDTISANKFSAPIKIFSGTNINGAQGVKQLVNRLNVVYAAVGGNHALYSTNGGTANIIADFSLYTTIRNAQIAGGNNGKEFPLPVYFNSFPAAIAVSGNRILTGTGTSTNNSYFPNTNSAVFPCGIWSVFFSNDGTTMEQMDYSLVFINGNIGSASFFGTTGDYAAVTVLRPLPRGQLAAGYLVQISGSSLGQVAIFDPVKYIQDINLTSLESELFEIGTFMDPQVPNNIEINLTKNLLSDQNIEVSYRKFTDANWSVIQTFNGTVDGSKNYYAIQQHDIGATQYLQIRIRANTGTTNPNDTVQLRNVIIS